MELTLDQALQKGIEAHKAGQVQEADRLYTAILKAQPKHADANHNMGVLAVGVGKVQEALPFFKTALEANPNTAQFWLSYIDALIKLEKLADAKAVLDQAKESGAKGDSFDKMEKTLEGVEPSETTASQNQDPPRDQLQPMINLYGQGQFQKTLDMISQLLQKFPNSVNLYNIQGAANAALGQLDAAIDGYKKALTIKPDYAEAYNNMGITLKKQGKLEEAIEAYSNALAIETNHTQAYFNMGAAFRTQGKLEEAIEAYQKALAIKPDFAEAYNSMGISLIDQGRLEEAIEAYSKALAIKPDYAEAHYNTGNALLHQGEVEEAIEAYSKALAIRPDYAEAYNNMGNALLDQGGIEEAIEAYNKALAIKPDYADAYNNMGNALQEKGKLKEAIDAYNKVIAIKSDYADAYYNIGVVLQKQIKLDEAIEAYNKALAIKPDHAEAHHNTGNILREQGKLKMAVEAYGKAIAIKSDYADAYFNMGQAFELQEGMAQKAIEAYTKTLAIEPDFPHAKSLVGVILFDNKDYEKAAAFFSDESLPNTNHNYLLRCFYELGEKEKFAKQLDYMLESGLNNARIGSYLSQPKAPFGIKKNNPFCNKPLNYISKIDLDKDCDFKKIFVENAANVLSNDEVKHRSQGNLKNGIQTAGNIFTQVGSVTEQWQNIIHAKLKNYKSHFCDSEEGLIRDWPSDYSIYGWLISMKNGGELSAHIHDAGWITGSIYINVPPKSRKDSGNLVLTTDDEKHGKRGNKNIKSIDVVTGSLVFFPSSLLHYTVPFESDEDRIVLAFDIMPKTRAWV